jgi:hypothetical protein
MSFRRHRGCRTTTWILDLKWNFLESRTIESDSLVHVKIYNPSSILSSAEHEKFCVKLPGPSGKAKYS